MSMKKLMIETIKAHNSAFDGENASIEEIETAYMSAIAKTGNSRTRLAEARIAAREMIAGATLPQPAKERLTERFTEATELFTTSDVNRAIEAERAYLARFTESGKPVLNFDQSIQVEDRSVRMGKMLDDFLSGKGPVHSFRECYIEITGDRKVSGDLKSCDMTRLRESTGSRFVEALDSASWANVLGNAINRRLLAMYGQDTDLKAWRKIVDVVPVSDFRTQERSQIGGYGNLPTVAEGGGYAALTSPDDAKATYALSKRGGTESITLEMIRNDDVGAIRRVPAELALAAANTLYEFVFDFVRTNPTIYDSKALFHVDHGNLGAAALDATSFAAARLSMIKQVRAGSGKRLGVGPATVLVPLELQGGAYDLFVRNQNLDKTFVQSINPEVIAVPYWTDENDWALVADPRRVPTIEVGFLDGKEDPELFVQDTPNAGSLFSNDQITYKIRHIYSGGVMDYRGFYKGAPV